MKRHILSLLFALLVSISAFAQQGISGWNPVKDAQDVLVDQDLVLTFNDPVVINTNPIPLYIRLYNQDTATEVENWVCIFGITGAGVTVVGNDLTINPAANLQAGTNYYVIIENGAIDGFTGIDNSAGNNWRFKTNPDLTFDPVKNATDVPLDKTMTLTFDSPISFNPNPALLWVRLFNQDLGTEVESWFTINGIAATGLSIAGNQLIINPTANLIEGTNYYITIDDGAIDGYSGIDNSASNNWRFKAISNPPSPQTYTPLQDATDVAINQNLQLTFDRDIQFATVTLTYYIRIYDQSTGLPVQNFIIEPGNTDPLLDITGTQLTINLRSNLDINTAYYVTIPNGVIESLFGAPYVGINNAESNNWRFTTVAEPIWATNYPLYENLTLTGIDLVGQTDKDGTYNYVVTSSPTAPSATQIKNGQDETGAAALITNSGTPGAMTGGVDFRESLDISGFSSETDYYIYLVATSTQSSLDSEVRQVPFTTLVFDPIWANGYPFTENLTLSNIDFVGQTDKDGTYNYVVTTSASTPSITQIKNGQDENGAAALITNSGTPGTMSGDIEFRENLDISGFTAETTYYIYMVATSTQGSVDSEIRQLLFTTLERNPPVNTFDPLDGSNNVSILTNVIVTFDEPVRMLNGTIIDNANVGGLISFLLNPANPIAFTATIDATKTIITILPDAPLSDNSGFDVTIAAVEDYNGNEQSSSSTTSFTTDGYVTWTGNNSTDWETNQNWSGNFNPGVSVNIPASATRMPIIDNLTTDVQNILIDAGASLSITGTGDLTVAGDLVINSSNDGAVGNGSLINNGALTVTPANVYIHQSVSSPTNTYYVSSPVGSATKANIGCDDAMYSYSNSTDSWSLAGDSDPMSAGKGYALRSAASLVFSGAINSNNNYLIPVTRTAGAGLGWNLVGNPYSAAVDWDLIDAGLKANLVDAIWIYLNDQGIYGTYSPIGGGINLASGEIPSNHAVWIKVLEGAYTDGSLTIPKSSLISNTTTLLKSSQAPNTYPRIKLAGCNGTYKDETLLTFADLAEDNIDKYDAEKKFVTNNNYLQLFTKEPSQSLAINSRSMLNGTDISIQLGYKAPSAGTFKIEKVELSNIPANTCILLEDTYKNGLTINLSEENEYVFTTESSEFNIDRFILHVRNDVSTDIETAPQEDEILIYGRNHEIIVEGKRIANRHYEVVTLDGTTIKQGLLKNNNYESIAMTTQGMFLFKIIDGKNSITKKVLLK